MDQVRPGSGTAKAGDISVTIDNSSRTFSPKNLSSPLVGNLIPGHAIQLYGYTGQGYYYNTGGLAYKSPKAYNGSRTATPLWGGFTSTIPVQQPGSTEVSVQVAGLGNLALTKPSPTAVPGQQGISTQLYQGITTDVALGYVLDALGFSASKRVLSTGNTVLNWWWLNNVDAFSAMQAILNSEGPGAKLYEDGSGNIVFENRQYRMTQTRCTTSQAKFYDGTASSGYQATVQALTPVGYWRLQETAGVTAYDYAATPHNGAYSSSGSSLTGVTLMDIASPSPMSGDYWADFDGTNGYVTVADTAALELTTVSVEAWVKFTTGGAARGIVSKWSDALNRGWSLNLAGSGNQIQWQVSVGGGFHFVLSPLGYNDGQRHHVVGTFDGVNLVLYVDGAVVATTPVAGAADTPAVPLYIGAVTSGAVIVKWFGSIAETALYGSALSAAQVLANFNAGTGFAEPVHMPPFTYEGGFQNIVNVCTVPQKVRSAKALGVVWTYGAGQSITISAGATQTILATATDPFTAALAPVSGTDFTVTSGIVASVTINRTSGQNVTITIIAGSAQLVISNLQLRAQTVSTDSSQNVTNSLLTTTSQGQYGLRPYTLQTYAEIAANVLQDFCDATVSWYSQPRAQVAMTLLASGGAARLAQANGRQVSDRVTLYESQTMVAGDFYVERFKRAVAKNGFEDFATVGMEDAAAPISLPSPTAPNYFILNTNKLNDSSVGLGW